MICHASPTTPSGRGGPSLDGPLSSHVPGSRGKGEGQRAKGKGRSKGTRAKGGRKGKGEQGQDPGVETEILNGQRAITGDTALRLAHFFGTSAEFWLNLQSLYELRLAEAKTGKAIKRLPTLKRLVEA
jgi:hypothetical protein